MNQAATNQSRIASGNAPAVHSSAGASSRFWRIASHIGIRYGLAVLGVFASWQITLVVWPWIKPNVGPVFFMVMIATAWFGGLGPALASTVLSIICMALWVPNGAEPPGFYMGDVARLVTFVLTAVLITWLNSSRKQAQAALGESRRLQGHLEEQRHRLEATNERLRQEVLERQRAQEEILAHQQTLRKLAADLSLTEERERREIASQLHDGVGQMLAFAQMRLESVLGSAGDGSRDGMNEALVQLKEAIGQTRLLTRELSPPVLYEASLENAMEWLADNIQRRHGLPVSIAQHGATGASAGVSRELRVFLFQAVRELLTNIVKHAKATQAHVTLFLQKGSIRVVVEDNGQGFIGGVEHRDGFGLLNIRERAAHLGGQCEIENDPGHGSRIMLTVPMEEENGVDHVV